MSVSEHEIARVLSEALPYMQRYDEANVVIKYGGHAMGDEHLAREFARDIVLLEQTAINPIVVHGGGPQIEAMLKRVGVEFRITKPDCASPTRRRSKLSKWCCPG